MHLGWVTSLPISRKIALERSVLFVIVANSDGLLSVRSPPGWSAIANAGGNNNAAADIARAASQSSLVLGFGVMTAVTLDPRVKFPAV
jgi:hypothetical protein